MRQFRVTVNGREYVVTVEETTDAGSAAPPPAPSAVPQPIRPATLPASAPAPSGAEGDELAQLAGTIVLVDVKIGQGVKQGDRLILMEAMKMKTPVIASRSGTVSRVLVKAGDTVEGGQPLVTIS
jgi:biotin carboxyl carrier protein